MCWRGHFKRQSQKDALPWTGAKKQYQKANKQNTKPNYSRAFIAKCEKWEWILPKFSEIIYDIRYIQEEYEIGTLLEDDMH